MKFSIYIQWRPTSKDWYIIFRGLIIKEEFDFQIYFYWNQSITLINFELFDWMIWIIQIDTILCIPRKIYHCDIGEKFIEFHWILFEMEFHFSTWIGWQWKYLFRNRLNIRYYLNTIFFVSNNQTTHRFFQQTRFIWFKNQYLYLYESIKNVLKDS